MKYPVFVLPAAKQDLYEILAWIKERSPQGAATWFRRWNNVLHSLENTPNSCGLAPENDEHTCEIRQMLFNTRRGRTYRALFTIRDNEVFVLRIRGAGQNLITIEDIELPEGLE